MAKIEQVRQFVNNNPQTFLLHEERTEGIKDELSDLLCFSSHIRHSRLVAIFGIEIAEKIEMETEND